MIKFWSWIQWSTIFPSADNPGMYMISGAGGDWMGAETKARFISISFILFWFFVEFQNFENEKNCKTLKAFQWILPFSLFGNVSWTARLNDRDRLFPRYVWANWTASWSRDLPVFPDIFRISAYVGHFWPFPVLLYSSGMIYKILIDFFSIRRQCLDC